MQHICPPTHPSEKLLEEFLRPLGISQSEFAVRIGVSFPRLNEIVRGKRSITTDTALRLERVLGMPADFWLGLQTDWDLWHALRSREADAITRLQPLEDRTILGERVTRVNLGHDLRVFQDARHRDPTALKLRRAGRALQRPTK